MSKPQRIVNIAELALQDGGNGKAFQAKLGRAGPMLGLMVLQVFALTFAMFVIYVLIKALIFQRAGAWVSVLGVTVFALVGFYNVYAFINVADLNRIVIHSDMRWLCC